MQNTYYGIGSGKKKIGFEDVQYGSYGAGVLVTREKNLK